MRILFIGTVAFSQHCLQKIIKHKGDVVAVFTLSPKRAKFNDDYADLQPLAVAHNISVHHVRKINDPETVELIRSLKPDVIFIFGFSQLISAELLQIPPLGCIGSHPALLPKNRGRHPLIWALVEGLTESGLTFFYLDEGADSGDILWQKSFPITLEDNAQSLYQKMEQLATEAIQKFLPQLAQGTAPRIPQDHNQATYWHKRTEVDGEIHWQESSLTSYNLIRALTKPYVGAHTYLGDQKMIIWYAQLPQSPLSVTERNSLPGTVLSPLSTGLRVRTGDGYLTILDYELMETRTIQQGTILRGIK